mmetsp:Transcript_37640/g.68096  ORF Transcript_37640/g.68096 Transcript_37640/m.68096 type:complete len:227 (+) Transcript_37640:78-758(+)
MATSKSLKSAPLLSWPIPPPSSRCSFPTAAPSGSKASTTPSSSAVNDESSIDLPDFSRSTRKRSQTCWTSDVFRFFLPPSTGNQRALTLTVVLLPPLPSAAAAVGPFAEDFSSFAVGFSAGFSDGFSGGGGGSGASSWRACCRTFSTSFAWETSGILGTSSLGNCSCLAAGSCLLGGGGGGNSLRSLGSADIGGVCGGVPGGVRKGMPLKSCRDCREGGPTRALKA